MSPHVLQTYRLFSFRLDGEFRTVALDHAPGLSPMANATDLYERFHAAMELEAPRCFDTGRITHLGYVDGFRPV